MAPRNRIPGVYRKRTKAPTFLETGGERRLRPGDEAVEEAILNSHCTALPSLPDPIENRAHLTVYYQNVRGLRTKTNALLQSLLSCDFDVVVFTETWLHTDITNAELARNYTIYRCDRNSRTSLLRRGGGVLIAVKSELNCKAVRLVGSENLEQIAVQVILPHQSLFVCCIYIRPCSHIDTYTKHAESVQQLLDMAHPHDTTIVVGDYNLPNLAWVYDEDVQGLLPLNASSEQELTIVESLLSAGLKQISDHVNTSGRLLDLVFVSDSDSIELFEPPSAILNVDRHHKPLVLKVDILSSDHQPTNPTARSEYNFAQCDFNVINARIAALDWSQLLDLPTINEAVSVFYDNVFQIIHDTVPVKTRRPSMNFEQPWWNPQLRNLRNRLRKARKRYFRSRTADNKSAVQLAEAEYNSLHEVRFREYIDNLQRGFKENPSSFWSFINARKRTTGIPVDVTYRNESSSTDSTSANLFSDFFQNVFELDYTPPPQQYIDQLPCYNIRLPQLSFSHDTIYRALCSVDASKGPGPDHIPPSFIKNCAASLAAPVMSIFNRSLLDGIFPDAWKLASITPIFKSGNIHSVENYRPISILNCLAKVLESLLHDKMYPAVQSIISEFQHGFMKKRSTISNLMTFTNTIIGSIEKRQQVDAVYIDFSKAFDKVPHELVVTKLSRLGLPPWIVTWIKSYLTDRKAFVKVRDVRSNVFDIPSGVPQGSHLGPLIFVLFVNDVCDVIHSCKLLYADDLKIYRVVKSLLDCCALQADVERLTLWCQINGMQANTDKCKIITFARVLSPIRFDYTMSQLPLERVDSIKDLGLILDSKLKFNEHISASIAKANSMLGFLRRNTAQFDDVYALKTLYCSLVRSVLEYGVQIWAPYHAVHVSRIERIQKRFVRYALRRLPWANPDNLPAYEHRCMLIGLQTLSSRRVFLQRLFIFDMITNHIDCSSVLRHIHFHAPARRLRNSYFLWIPGHHTDYGFNNPLDKCCRLFNDVSDVFDFSISRLVFKNRIKIS